MAVILNLTGCNIGKEYHVHRTGGMIPLQNLKVQV